MSHVGRDAAAIVSPLTCIPACQQTSRLNLALCIGELQARDLGAFRNLNRTSESPDDRERCALYRSWQVESGRAARQFILALGEPDLAVLIDPGDAAAVLHGLVLRNEKIARGHPVQPPVFGFAPRQRRVDNIN